MKFLITGGAGFIGSHLATYLVGKNNEVAILDNFSTGKRENIRGLPVELIKGDIRNIECLDEAVAGVDTVFHQAALCSVVRSVNDPLSTHEVNATGTLKVLEACRRAGVRRVVFASSSSVYGDAESLPKLEQMPAAPLSPYAVSKLIGEHYCQLYWKAFGLETVALRYFNVFGPRQDPDSEYAAVIPKFMQALVNGEPLEVFGDGSQTRDFTYVENVVLANVAAAMSARAAGKVMNIACGSRWSLLDLLARLNKLFDTDVSPILREWRKGDVRHSQASIDLAQKLIGFWPQVGFEQGLNKTVGWYLSSRRPEREVVTRVLSDTRESVPLQAGSRQ
ncbi:MAG: SDR family oxidoreductase [Pseudohongiellaceae bacterium]